MTGLNRLTLSEARDLLRKKEFTSLELTETCLSAMEEGARLNAFVHGTAEIALNRARSADVRLATGDAPDMCGLPIGIKDIFCTKSLSLIHI